MTCEELPKVVTGVCAFVGVLVVSYFLTWMAFRIFGAIWFAMVVTVMRVESGFHDGRQWRKNFAGVVASLWVEFWGRLFSQFQVVEVQIGDWIFRPPMSLRKVRSKRRRAGR